MSEKTKPNRVITIDTSKLEELTSSELRMYIYYTGICQANNNHTNFPNSELVKLYKKDLTTCQRLRRSLINKGFMAETDDKKKAVEVAAGKFDFKSKVYHSITDKGIYINPKGETLLPNVKRPIKINDDTKLFKSLVIANDCKGKDTKGNKDKAFREFQQLPLDTKNRMPKALNSYNHSKNVTEDKFKTGLVNFIGKKLYAEFIDKQIKEDLRDLDNTKREIDEILKYIEDNEARRQSWLKEPNEDVNEVNKRHDRWRDEKASDLREAQYKYNKLKNKLNQ